MATRPQGATRSSRARLADRDEYPALGLSVKVATHSGLVMGPPPRVQLTLRSTTSSPTLTIVKPVVAAPVQRAPKREVSSPFAPPAPVVQSPETARVEQAPAPARVVRAPEPARFIPIVEPATAVAIVPVPAPAVIPKPVRVAAPPEVSLTVPVELSAPETLTMPALAGRALKRRQETGAARALSPEAAGSLESPLSRKAVIERTRHIIEQGKRRQLLLVAASVVVIAGVLIGTLRYAARADAAAQPNTNWNQITTVMPSTLPSVSTSASAATTTVAPTTAAATTADSVPVAPATTTAVTPEMAVLTKNAMYAQNLAIGSCDPLGKPGTTSQAQAVITEYVECMNDVWGKVLTASNRSFRKASVEFFVNTAVSPCGDYNPDTTNAAYCLNNTTLYVSSSALKKAAADRYYAAELVTHEYAHHVQNLTGILNAAYQVWHGTDEYSRRIEMQAHCLSFAVMTHVPGFGVTATDLAMFRSGWATGPSNAKFGSIASQQAYGEKGLAATKVGDCETFSAATVS